MFYILFIFLDFVVVVVCLCYLFIFFVFVMLYIFIYFVNIESVFFFFVFFAKKLKLFTCSLTTNIKSRKLQEVLRRKKKYIRRTSSFSQMYRKPSNKMNENLNFLNKIF